MDNDAEYICDSCGEEIVIPVDIAAGEFQSYVEDCPVCCNPNVISVQIDENGEIQAFARSEQDHR